MTTQLIDDQPISASFFGEGKWLTDFIRPKSLEVQRLYAKLTDGIRDPEDRIVACWNWVASEVKYKEVIYARINVAGKISVQQDYWAEPGQTICTCVGNCANKAFLLTSLLRNEYPSDKVYCVLGNLYNGKPGGHAWVQVAYDGDEFVVEATRPDVQPLVRVSVATRYEPVHLFNDEVVTTVPGATALEPFTRCYSVWLRDYLDWAYIKGRS